MFAALTNYHKRYHPLCDDNSVFHGAYKSRLYAIGNDILENSQKAQSLYRVKRSRRMESTLLGPQIENEEIFSASYYELSNFNVPT